MNTEDVVKAESQLSADELLDMQIDVRNAILSALAERNGEPAIIALMETVDTVRALYSDDTLTAILAFDLTGGTIPGFGFSPANVEWAQENAPELSDRDYQTLSWGLLQNNLRMHGCHDARSILDMFIALYRRSLAGGHTIKNH